MAADTNTSDKTGAVKQGTGNNENTWGTKLNDEMIEPFARAIAGYLAKDCAGASDVTLSASEAYYGIIKCTGTLTGSINVIVPTASGKYVIHNGTSGAYTLTVKTSAGTGIAVTQGEKAWLYCDGTNVLKLIATDDYITSTLAASIDTNGNAIQFSEGAAVASASSCDIWGNDDGNAVHITGTTDIDDFATAPRAGAWMLVVFDDACPVNDSATITVDGNANWTSAATDMALVYAETTTTFKFKPLPNDGKAIGSIAQGKHTVWIPAKAWTPTETNGCATQATVETTAGRPDLKVLDFDASTDEHAQTDIAWPPSWNNGTLTYRYFWTSTATDTDGVTFALQGVACADGDTADVAFGTAVTVDDANQSTAEDIYVSAESGAVTIAGSPGDNELTFLQIFRDVSDANDTAAEDARLIGVQLFYTVNAADDS